MKAVILVVRADAADHIAGLIAAMLQLNGYGPHEPAVVDWPPVASGVPAEGPET